MAERHINVPKPLATGDPVEWFTKFEICCRANEWNDDKKIKKLPTLLEGEALALWLELSDEDQADYAKAKKAITEKMCPASFVSLDEFHLRKMHPGESLSLFVHELKKLLNQAMPTLEKNARDQLLLHQFLSDSVSSQIRATGDITTLEKAVEKARLLMTITAAIGQPEDNSMQQLKEQLTEQVAALSTQKSASHKRHQLPIRQCFFCNGSALSVDRPTLTFDAVYSTKLLAGKRQWGTCDGQQASPAAIGPHTIDVITVAAVKTNAIVTGKIGGTKIEMMLDSGSSVSLIRQDMITCSMQDMVRLQGI